MVAVNNTPSQLLQKGKSADLVKGKNTALESVKVQPQQQEQKTKINTEATFTAQNVDGHTVITLQDDQGNKIMQTPTPAQLENYKALSQELTDAMIKEKV